MIKKAIAALSICLSFVSSASFIGDEITISGIPGYGGVNTTIQQSEIELIDSGSSGIQFYCGDTLESSFACGFIKTFATPSLFINISEMLGGDVRIDVSLAGDFEAFTTTINGFDSNDGSFQELSLLHDGGYLLPFVDPNTGEIIVPTRTGTQGSVATPLGSDLGLAFTSDSVSFSLPANTYNNGFSVVMQTSSIPIPAAVWLFGSGLAGLSVLRRNRSKQ